MLSKEEALAVEREQNERSQPAAKAGDGELARLQAQLAEVTADRDSWKRECEMYGKAWQRELGNRLIPKTHLIDALVLTTRLVIEERDGAYVQLAKIRGRLVETVAELAPAPR
jgi:hypothetical protein